MPGLCHPIHGVTISLCGSKLKSKDRSSFGHKLHPGLSLKKTVGTKKAKEKNLSEVEQMSFLTTGLPTS